MIYDFQGNAIRLPWERWLHIIDPSGKHEYMELMRPELVETIRNPETIVQSNRSPDTVRIYHRWFEDTAVGSKWVRVFIRFFDHGDAFVLTAFAKNTVARGQELWRREEQ